MTDYAQHADSLRHEDTRLEARRPRSTPPPRSGSPSLNDRSSLAAPCEGTESRPEQPARLQQSNLKDIDVNDHEERISLLPYENERSLPSEDSRNNHNHSSPDHAEKVAKIPAVTLPSSSYIVWMVSIYASLALTAWILICLLTFKPLTTDHYGFDTREKDASRLQAKYVKSEEIYRAARTVQAVVGVLTIPLTSAVCSAAAVVFAQSKPRGRHLTMRQMMTLADKGWTDPTSIVKLISGRGRKISSTLLICALLLSLLGASITPLQTVLTTQETIKIPNAPSNFRISREAAKVVDIPDKFRESSEPSLVNILTRNALKSTSNTTPQPRLWQENIGCSSLNETRTEPCVLRTSTLGNLSALSKPYLAQLPVGYHTGVIKQFIPRIDSAVQWENVPREDMPADCGQMPGSFYAIYANATWPPEDQWNLIGGAPRNWSIDVCMPGNQSQPPWSNTYNRQSFTEVLYLNISVMGYENDGISTEDFDSPTTGGVFKITSETTTGYFELPNYMNGGQAGPIIDGDPDDDENCGFDCEIQAFRHDTITSRAVSSVSNFQSNDSLSLATVANKGPLLTVAIALFGYDSFISARLNNPESFIRDYDSWPKAGGGSSGPWVSYASACVDQKPLSSLLLDADDGSSSDCVSDTIQELKQLDRELAKYVQSFYYFEKLPFQQYRDPERSRNAFASAVFLANEAWLTSDVRFANRRVSSDPGADIIVPVISRTGMVLISSLWLVYIACLFSLAFYSARTPRWTAQLDAFAMMRVGAAMNDKIILDVGFETNDIDVLDNMLGTIGDATGGEGDVGVLGVGARTPLRARRRYKCYEGDEKEALRRADRRAERNGRPPAQRELRDNPHPVQNLDRA